MPSRLFSPQTLFFSVSALLLSQNLFANPSPNFFTPNSDYVGFWDSCRFPDGGTLEVRIQTVKSDSVVLDYTIHDSVIFDGSPYPSQATLDVSLELDTKARKVGLAYDYPLPFLSFLSSLWSDSVALSGKYYRSGRNGWRFRVQDQGLKVNLTINPERLYGRYDYNDHGKDHGVFSLVRKGSDKSPKGRRFECRKKPQKS